MHSLCSILATQVSFCSGGTIHKLSVNKDITSSLLTTLENHELCILGNGWVGGGLGYLLELAGPATYISEK